MAKKLLTIFLAVAFGGMLLHGCQGRELSLKLITENFTQDLVEVDILFVVDNSTSLKEEVDLVKSAIGELVQELVVSTADFHIGVVTANVGEQDSPDNPFVSSPPAACVGIVPAENQAGKLQNAPGVPAVLTAEQDSADVIANFTATIDHIETDPAAQTCVFRKGCEAFREAARLAIDPAVGRNDGSGFRRENALLAMIFISDEDDTSIQEPTAIADSDDNCLDFDPDEFTAFDKVHESADDYLNFFSQLTTGRFLYNGVITLPGDIGSAECASVSPAEESTSLLEAIESTEGFSASICETDYTDILESLGVNIVNQLGSFEIQLPADPSTLTVSVNGIELSGTQYEYDQSEQTVRITNPLPQPGDEVEITYFTDPEGLTLTN